LATRRDGATKQGLEWRSLPVAETPPELGASAE
jgi:hypothetical protein